MVKSTTRILVCEDNKEGLQLEDAMAILMRELDEDLNSLGSIPHDSLINGEPIPKWSEEHLIRNAVLYGNWLIKKALKLIQTFQLNTVSIKGYFEETNTNKEASSMAKNKANLLMSVSNPKGWKLEELLDQIRLEVIEKNGRVKPKIDDVKGVAAVKATISGNNENIIGLLEDCIAFQNSTMKTLDYLKEDSGPSSRRI